MIKPTIGRRVWYWPSTSANAHRILAADPPQPHDAGVVFVHNDRRVNLDVTDHMGRHYFVGNCYLWQSEDDPDPGHIMRPTEDFAEWMPYQRGQAAKAQPASVLDMVRDTALDPLGR